MTEPTIAHLRKIMPGQPDVWYQRIAKAIASGQMPMPRIDGTEESRTVDANRRYLDALTDSKPGNFPSTGQYQPPKPTPKPTPKTVSPLPPSIPVSILRSNLEQPPLQKSPDLEPSPQRPLAISSQALEQLAQKRKAKIPKKRDTSVSGKTRSELSRLCPDRDIADRLLFGTRERNPEKSEQWVWDKVIWDLERDRM
jgi:hypothetical protein